MYVVGVCLVLCGRCFRLLDSWSSWTYSQPRCRLTRTHPSRVSRLSMPELRRPIEQVNRPSVSCWSSPHPTTQKGGGVGTCNHGDGEGNIGSFSRVVRRFSWQEGPRLFRREGLAQKSSAGDQRGNTPCSLSCCACSNTGGVRNLILTATHGGFWSWGVAHPFLDLIRWACAYSSVPSSIVPVSCSVLLLTESCRILHTFYD